MPVPDAGPTVAFVASLESPAPTLPPRLSPDRVFNEEVRRLLPR